MFKSKRDKLEKELFKELKKEEKEKLEEPKEEIIEDIKNEFSESESLTENTFGESDEEIKKDEINKIEELESQVTDLKDKLLRKVAEFENYKRRSEADMSVFFKYASENVIKDLLTVLDDFDRVQQSWNENHDAEILGKGFELLQNKFRKVLEKQGLRELDSIGKPFDVNVHDALMMSPTNEIKPDTVIEVAEKGYKLKDKVIRHAKVIVSVESKESGESKSE